jgi:hypothetical protein
MSSQSNYQSEATYSNLARHPKEIDGRIVRWLLSGVSHSTAIFSFSDQREQRQYYASTSTGWQDLVSKKPLDWTGNDLD